LFGLAAVYDTWKSPDGPLSTCSILTCDPKHNKLSTIHDRMPVILRPVDYRFYLDRTVTSLEDLMPVLAPYSDDDMYYYPVSPMVGNVRNDGPECIAPVG
jgi:putative SOS response-associated peptidase YedK